MPLSTNILSTLKPTVLSRLLAHVPISEHAPLLEYWRTEINHDIYIYNIGTPTFSINSQNAFFWL